MNQTITLQNKTNNNIVIDTNLLMNDDTIIDRLIKNNNIIISIVTIEELDNLKKNRDYERSSKARRAIKAIEKNRDSIIFGMNKEVYKKLLPQDNIINYFNLNDDIILSSALYSNAILATEDLNMRIKASAIGVECLESEPIIYYKGYKEITPSDEELSSLYSDTKNNIFNCITNEYLVIRNQEGDIIDLLRWNGEEYRNIYNKSVKTMSFGDKIRAKDCYQKMAIDSIMNNTMTAISGKAGSGKSLISLMCAMYLVENGKYDRVVILNNPTKVRGATDLGYYTGSMTEKMMQNSIGNILNTKFGDRLAVDMLIQQDKLRIVSMADARGMEIRDNEILYITECQNTSIDLLKLSLQRVSQDAKIIIEGDIFSQVDSFEFEGRKNGMRRSIEVLKGKPEFGYIELKNVWRSKIAEMVDIM